MFAETGNKIWFYNPEYRDKSVNFSGYLIRMSGNGLYIFLIS